MIKDYLSNLLSDVFESLGLHAIFGVTLLGMLILLSYRKDIKQWRALRLWHKTIILSTFLGTIIFTIISILIILGLIAW